MGTSKSLVFSKRDVNHKHLPYSKNTNSYKWNVEQSIDANYLINPSAVDSNGTVSIDMLVFRTPEERDNASRFYYSDQGFRSLAKLFTAVNIDGRTSLNKILPKGDWTKSDWTVETILTEFGYTNDEVKQVIDDLTNYKYLED